MVASLHCSWPTHCLNHLYRLSVNYRAKACPDIQQNCKDICERFLVGGFLTRLMIFPIVTCTWWLDEVRCQNSQHEGSFFLIYFFLFIFYFFIFYFFIFLYEGSWQGVFMVNNESAVQTWKKNVLVNLLTGFPVWLFQSLQMHCRVFGNLADCEF